MFSNRRPTRLLAVIPTMRIGGAERQMALLLNGLDRIGYSLGLACCNLDGHLLREVPESVRLFDLGKRSRWHFPFLVARLRRTLREFRPEFVLASMEYATLLAWLANRLGDRQAQIIARKEAMPSQARWGESLRGLKGVVDRAVEHRVDMVIAPSRGILDEIRPRMTRRRIPMVRIPNVVDLDRFQGLKRQRDASEAMASLRVVVMGRFVPWKGFDLVLRAVSLLPRGTISLHLIGDGPERGPLERLARELSITAQAEFTGFRADPFPLLASADIGVLPSTFEPFGNVIVEMFASGLPVLAFDVDYGPREVIRDGDNGLLISTRDPMSLASAIDRLRRNPDSIREMGRKAREDAVKNYGLQAAVSAYQACFESLRKQDFGLQDSGGSTIHCREAR